MEGGYEARLGHELHGVFETVPTQIQQALLEICNSIPTAIVWRTISGRCTDLLTTEVACAEASLLLQHIDECPADSIEYIIAAAGIAQIATTCKELLHVNDALFDTDNALRVLRSCTELQASLANGSTLNNCAFHASALLFRQLLRGDHFKQHLWCQDSAVEAVLHWCSTSLWERFWPSVVRGQPNVLLFHLIEYALACFTSETPLYMQGVMNTVFELPSRSSSELHDGLRSWVTCLSKLPQSRAKTESLLAVAMFIDHVMPAEHARLRNGSQLHNLPASISTPCAPSPEIFVSLTPEGYSTEEETPRYCGKTLARIGVPPDAASLTQMTFVLPDGFMCSPNNLGSPIAGTQAAVCQSQSRASQHIGEPNCSISWQRSLEHMGRSLFDEINNDPVHLAACCMLLKLQSRNTLQFGPLGTMPVCIRARAILDTPLGEPALLQTHELHSMLLHLTEPAACCKEHIISALMMHSRLSTIADRPRTRSLVHLSLGGESVFPTAAVPLVQPTASSEDAVSLRESADFSVLPSFSCIFSPTPLHQAQRPRVTATPQDVPSPVDKTVMAVPHNFWEPELQPERCKPVVRVAPVIIIANEDDKQRVPFVNFAAAQKRNRTHLQDITSVSNIGAQAVAGKPRPVASATYPSLALFRV